MTILLLWMFIVSTIFLFLLQDCCNPLWYITIVHGHQTSFNRVQYCMYRRNSQAIAWQPQKVNQTMKCMHALRARGTQGDVQHLSRVNRMTYWANARVSVPGASTHACMHACTQGNSSTSKGSDRTIGTCYTSHYIQRYISPALLMILTHWLDLRCIWDEGHCIAAGGRGRQEGSKLYLSE